MPAPFSAEDIARELADYQVVLGQDSLGLLCLYLNLVLRWNRRINLTALRTPRRVVGELFGESLYVTRVVQVRGRVVDVGSGAGFPGLALKLAVPDLHLVLVESNRRKCAFLKEVVRTCGFRHVRVVGERFEDWAGKEEGKVDLITTRAVDISPPLLDYMGRVAMPAGQVVFLTSAALARRIRSQTQSWNWVQEIPIPQSRQRVILVGTHSQ